MTAAPDASTRDRILNPIDRTSEVLFGLFMTLTFTGTLSVASAGRDDVRTMLIAAIGCNIAWGFVDAVMYVLRNLVARGHQAAFLRAVRDAPQPAQAHALIAAELQSTAGALGPKALEHLHQWLLQRPASQLRPPRLRVDDLRGAAGVFLLVVASTLPPVLPFVFIADLRLAVRVSAGLAIVMLFLAGAGWGRYAGLRPVPVGLLMVALGAAIQAVVIALGG